MTIDGTGLNMEWVASFSSFEDFLKDEDVAHLYPSYDPDQKTAVLKLFYDATHGSPDNAVSEPTDA